MTRPSSRGEFPNVGDVLAIPELGGAWFVVMDTRWGIGRRVTSGALVTINFDACTWRRVTGKTADRARELARIRGE